MGIKRYIATADNTITNAFEANLTTRGTGSNMGESDVTEVFSIFGQDSGSGGYSSELSRVLYKFPVTSIINDRTNETIPASGSVNFYLRLFNAKHAFTLPRNYWLSVAAVTQSWEEGTGLDMENYSDLTYNGEGSNWEYASSGSVWTKHAADAVITVLTSTPSDLDGEHIAIRSADDRLRTYLFDDDDALGSTGASTANGIIVQINGLSSAATIAEQIEDAIEHSNGHDDEITVDRDGATITLTQATAGTAGNTNISTNVGSAHITIPLNFGHGSDGYGGNYHAQPQFSASYDRGNEDLELNITDMVEMWVDGRIPDTGSFGLGVFLSGSYESQFSASDGTDSATNHHNPGGSKRSYYTKKFFARGTEFFFKKPCIEARWDSSKKDNRANVFFSSSLAAAEDNVNTLYLYNYARGQLRNIPEIGKGHLYVSLFSGSTEPNALPYGQALHLVEGAGDVPLGNGVDALTAAKRTGCQMAVITASYVETGVYSASFALTASNPNQIIKLFDVWFKGSATVNAVDGEPAHGIQYHTGSFYPKLDNNSNANIDFSTEYATKILNLKPSYKTHEKPRLRVFSRDRNWNPNIYTKAVSTLKPSIVEDAYYKVARIIDNEVGITYGTSSLSPSVATSSLDYTRLSYDTSGSYFELDMALLEKDYSYEIKLLYYMNNSYEEQPESFKFRIEK